MKGDHNAKARIVEAVKETNGYTQQKAFDTIELMLELIKRSLETGEDVLISSFGKFCVKKRQSGEAGIRLACMDEFLPASSSLLDYAESNPEFRKKLIDTYFALPYDVQARTGIFSPQFYEDLKRFKAKGMPTTEIGRQLGISDKTVKILLGRIL